MPDDRLDGIKRLGPTTLASAYQQINARQRREWSARRAIDEHYRAVTQGYKQELEDAFYRYFVYPADAAPHWDAVLALRSDVIPSMHERFDEMLDGLKDDTAEIALEDETESFLEGFYFGLWDLFQAGADSQFIQPPSESDIHALVAAVVFGGIPVIQRADRWFNETRGKLQSFRANIISERTLGDTLQWFDGVMSSLNGRINTLVGNNSYQAFQAGRDAALSMYSDLVLGMVWMTREDPFVCQEHCAPLHGQVTDKLPVIDTHPNCRCYLVPLLASAGSRPIDFSLFMQEYQRAQRSVVSR